MIINSPLRIPQSKKRMFILNLNNYRNAHYQTLNTVKKRYKEYITDQIKQLPIFNKVTIHYKLFPKTKRLTDIGNVTSVHKKFFEDALVELKHLPDDNYLFVIGSSESFGHIDKENPRVEITITKVP